MKEPNLARVATLRRLGLAEENAESNDFDVTDPAISADGEQDLPAAQTPLPAVQSQRSLPHTESTPNLDCRQPNSALHDTRHNTSTAHDAKGIEGETKTSGSAVTIPRSKGQLFGRSAVAPHSINSAPDCSATDRISPPKNGLGMDIALGLARMLLVLNGAATVVTVLLWGFANLRAFTATITPVLLLPAADHFILGTVFAFFIAVFNYGAQIITLEFPSWRYSRKLHRVAQRATIVVAVISFAEVGLGALSMIAGLKTATMHDAVVSISAPIAPTSATQSGGVK